MIPDLSSKFISWELAPAEQTQGCILSTQNKDVIRNLIRDIAEEKLSMDFNPAEPQRFMQREAELKGQLGILQHLLSLSELAEKEITSGDPA